MLEGRDICRAVGLPASTCLAVPPHRRDGIAWERGRPARILSLWPPLSFSRDAAGSYPVGGNCSGQAEGEPWRRAGLIQVGEMAEAVPGLVRAGRPRSREAIIVRAGRPRSQQAIIP